VKTQLQKVIIIIIIIIILTTSVLQTARYLKTEVQRETRKIKDSIAKKTKERWHGKRMHRQLPRSLDEKLVDIEQSYRWLKIWRH